jgi:hypothetical protein
LKNEFEAVFSEFIAEFGGEVLPEPSDAKIADYLFRKQNIVAELKCLMCDQTEEMNKKVTRVVQDWVRKHKKLPPGYEARFWKLRRHPRRFQTRGWKF